MTSPGTHPGQASEALIRQLLAVVGAGAWTELNDVLHPQFVITEPASLPWGGDHYGIDGYRDLITTIAGAFALDFHIEAVLPGDATTVMLSNVTFTHRTSGRSQVIPVAEAFSVIDERLASSRVYLDSGALLALLHDGW